jgi:thiosulfate dehydrogenase [quinone] large subunit
LCVSYHRCKWTSAKVEALEERQRFIARKGGAMMARTTAGTVTTPGYTNFQLTALVVLRLLIGWHFFYEGLAKLINPYWTAAGFLSESQWWFKGFFVSLAANPGSLAIIDFLLGLLLGGLTRVATIAGIVLLFLYYIATPPFVGYVYSMPAEGSYLIVNKVLIELGALVVLLAFPTGALFGLDRLLLLKRARESEAKRQDRV